GIERIVKDEDIAAKPGGRSLHAGGEHGASPGVLIVALEVLIARKGENTAPALLVPIRLNHTAAEDAVLRAELLRVRDEHEAARGIRRPHPYGKKDGNEEALHGARGHVEDDAFQLSADFLESLVADEGEIVTDKIKVPVPLKVSDRFENVPRLVHEILES